MEIKKEEIKVSVTNDPAAEESGRRSKARVLKKSSAAKAIKTSSVAKSGSRKNIKSHLVTNAITFVIAAVVFGGGIYLWLAESASQGVDEAQKTARQSRVGFEKKIEELKDKVQSVISEKDQIAKENEALKAKTDELLAAAKKEYKDQSIGIGFLYPASFGDVALKMEDGAKGKRFIGTFTGNEDFYFGGVSADFEPATTTAASSTIIDSQGYYSRSSKYYFQGIGDENSREHEINPVKTVKYPNGDALLSNQSSSVSKEGDVFGINENLGAVVNTGKEEFRGVVFVNKNFEKLSEEKFEQFLKSINNY